MILAAAAKAVQSQRRWESAGFSLPKASSVQQGPTIDIVIPIYNERDSVPELVRRLRQEEGIQLVRHGSNLGYGQSLIDGLEAGDGELVVQIDADLEYRPEDVPAIVEALGAAEAVYGSRFLDTTRAGIDMEWHRSLGNRLVTTLFNRLFRQRLTDLYTGIRGFRRDVLGIPLHRPGFEFVLEVAARLAQRGVHIREVPVGYDPRRTGRSKMRHVPELAKFAYWLVRLRFSR
jgi:glycosyltransferase involved in cell wall biosynthesis